MKELAFVALYALEIPFSLEFHAGPHYSSNFTVPNEHPQGARVKFFKTSAKKMFNTEGCIWPDRSSRESCDLWFRKLAEFRKNFTTGFRDPLTLIRPSGWRWDYRRINSQPEWNLHSAIHCLATMLSWRILIPCLMLVHCVGRKHGTCAFRGNRNLIVKPSGRSRNEKS